MGLLFLIAGVNTVVNSNLPSFMIPVFIIYAGIQFNFIHAVEELLAMQRYKRIKRTKIHMHKDKE